MAAGSLSEAFAFDLKRKRRYDDDDLMIEHDLSVSKRPNLSKLPLRAPTRPTIAVTPAFGVSSFVSGTLTPDSIPEDDSCRQQNEQTLDVPFSRRPKSYPGLDGNSLRLITTPDPSPLGDTDILVGSPDESIRPPPTPIRVGRARSNDLLSPLRSPVTSTQFGSPITGNFARDRLPTPVASSFPARSPFETSFATAAARQLRPHVLQHSTSLTPMIDAESWTPRIQRPPSPAPDLDEPFDEDAMMAGLEDSQMSSDFTNLSVHSQDNLHELPATDSSPLRNWSPQSSNVSPRNRGLGLEGAATNHGGIVRPDGLRMSTIADTQRPSSAGADLFQHTRVQSSARTAKLHMGFKADCEKCIARVPGHYSHIIWS